MSETREWAFPASYAQERVWFSNQLDPGSPVYNVSLPHGLPEGLTVAQATEALNRLVARHEALRTHLRVDADALVQVVRAPEPFTLEVLDLTDTPPERERERIYAAAEELARTPIPLGRPPLWRAKLTRLARAPRAVVRGPPRGLRQPLDPGAARGARGAVPGRSGRRRAEVAGAADPVRRLLGLAA
jgi:hypothetical protein